MSAFSRLFLPFVFSVAIIGCSSEPASKENPSTRATPAGQKYLLADEPKGAQAVTEVGESSKDDQQVTVVGRIGGSAKPWIEGMAAFTIVDESLEPCAPDEGCPTPWDYCCSINSIPKAALMVQVVDEGGKPLQSDAREMLGLKELQTVVVQGRVQRDADDSIVVLADGIHVKK